MTIGQRIITLHFLMTYLFPFVGNVLFSSSIQSIYKIHSPTILSTTLILIVYFSYLTLSGLLGRRGAWTVSETTRNRWAKLGDLYRRKRLVIALAAFLVGAYFFYQDLSSYRYSNLSILQRGSFSLVTGILVSTIAVVDLIYFMFVHRAPVPTLSRLWKENVLMAGSMLLVVDGTGNMILASYCLFYAVFPSLFQTLFFVDVHRSWRQRLSNFTSLGAISVVIFAVAWTYGESIKNSSNRNFEAESAMLKSAVDIDTADDVRSVNFGLFTINFSASRAQVARQRWKDRLENFETRLETLSTKVTHFARTGEWLRTSRASLDDTEAPILPKGGGAGAGLMVRLKKFLEVFASVDLGTYAYYLVERLSAHYYSYMHVVNTPKDELKFKGERSLMLPIRTFVYRVDGMFGGVFGVQRPEITSISQLNYRKLVVVSPRERDGTSPGVLGSFGYAFPFPISLLVCLIYLCLLSNLFDALFEQSGGKTIPIIGTLLLLNLFALFFDSPIDFLQIADNATEEVRQ